MKRRCRSKEGVGTICFELGDDPLAEKGFKLKHLAQPDVKHLFLIFKIEVRKIQGLSILDGDVSESE